MNAKTAQRTRVEFREQTVNIRVGHQKISCANCKRPAPIELISQSKATAGWCFYCTEHFGTRAKARRTSPMVSKIANTIARHSDRMHIDAIVLREEYGWDKNELLRMLKEALDRPCVYCNGLRYGALGTLLTALPLNRVSLDLYLSGEPYLANMRWCCAKCNCVKRDVDPKTWQLYCTYYPKWCQEFYEIKLREFGSAQTRFDI